jgi:cytochrome c553
MKTVKDQIKTTLITSLLFVAGSIGVVTTSYADPEVDHDTAVGKLSTTLGGRLYDNWWEVLQNDEPKSAHPSYPAGGEATGSKTWRCTEFHGWDYKGAAGIKGVLGMAGSEPSKIKAILRDKTHQYTPQMLTDKAVDRLADFISYGLVDVDLYIDRTSMTPKGDAKRGKVVFESICALCHGENGKAINFGSHDDPEYVGTVAKFELLEAFHKVRNGQPSQPMMSLITQPIQMQIDVLTYEQTLPTSD